MKRTNVVKLVVDKETHEKLKELGIVTAKYWNEVNWLRMQQFKKRERVDFAKTEKEVSQLWSDENDGVNHKPMIRSEGTLAL